MRATAGRCHTGAVLAVLDPYRTVARIPGVPAVIALGLLLRVPLFAATIVLTLHVVGTLGATWTQAGVATTLATLAGAISSPYRGRLLDRRGLRATLVPCLVVSAACWAVAPFVGYWPLVALTVLAGVFLVPTFTVGRQALIALTPPERLQAALSLDSAGVEIAYMAGPLLGVWAASVMPTSWCLLVFQMTSVAAGVLLVLVDPPLRAAEHAEAAGHRASEWVSPAFVAVVAAAGAASLVLAGTEIAIIAFLRAGGHVGDTGWVLAVWGLGSLVGGLVYGLLPRGVGVFGLLALLSLVTLPAAAAHGVASLAVLVTLAGLLCAPTISASAAAISRVVPPTAVGEAMGWQGSAMTLGSAVGAPLVGVTIDRAGAASAFGVVGAVGLVVAGAGYAAARVRRGRAAAGAAPAPAPAGAGPDEGERA